MLAADREQQNLSDTRLLQVNRQIVCTQLLITTAFQFMTDLVRGQQFVQPCLFGIGIESGVSQGKVLPGFAELQRVLAVTSAPEAAMTQNEQFAQLVECMKVAGVAVIGLQAFYNLDQPGTMRTIRIAALGKGTLVFQARKFLFELLNPRCYLLVGRFP